MQLAQERTNSTWCIPLQTIGHAAAAAGRASAFLPAGSWTLARCNKASAAVDALLLARRAKNRLEFRLVSSFNGTYTEKLFSVCNISLSVVLGNEFLTPRAFCLRNRQLGRFLNSMRSFFFDFLRFSWIAPGAYCSKGTFDSKGWGFRVNLSIEDIAAVGTASSTDPMPRGSNRSSAVGGGVGPPPYWYGHPSLAADWPIVLVFPDFPCIAELWGSKFRF